MSSILAGATNLIYMHYLFFDTETTGTPKDYKGNPRDLDNWPRIIQLAWAFYEDDTLLSKQCCLIRPDGWEMPTGKFWVDNGFSQEKSMKEGMSIEAALLLFSTMLAKTDYVIAHNMAFDLPITQSEMIRLDMKVANKPKKICTMLSSKGYVAIPGPYGDFKWPKLEELHKKVFGVSFDGAHDALNDVMATAACFFELVRLGVIKLEAPK